MQALTISSLFLNDNIIKLSFKNEIEIAGHSPNHLNISNRMGYTYSIDNVSPSIVDALSLLQGEFFSKNELGNRVYSADGLGALSLFLYNLEKLEFAGCILYTVFSGSSACFSYENMTGAARFEIESLHHQKFRFSKFSYIRKEVDYFIIESSKGTAKITIYDNLIFNALAALSKFSTIEQIVEKTDTETEQILIAFLAALNAGSYLEIEQVSTEAEAEEFWSFHELLFHTRSRFGRQNYNVGATYRFMGKKAYKKPEMKINNALKEITLSIPSPEEIHSSKSLVACMNERHSSRYFDGFDLNTLGKFLHRCLHIKGKKDFQAYGPNNKTEVMELLSAPYPSGGSIYELCFYLTICDCTGIEPGFYQYNPFEHKLCLLQHPNHYTEKMMYHAKTSMGCSEDPPVLITFSADFERMFWKYENMAYAAIMKNVGVIYQTMYLVATDMGIGSCALGNGNIAVFQKLNQKSFLQESSVGEFLLGFPQKK